MYLSVGQLSEGHVSTDLYSKVKNFQNSIPSKIYT